MRRHARWVSASLLTALVAVPALAGCSATEPGAQTPTSSASTPADNNTENGVADSALAGTRLWVNPDGHAAAQSGAWTKQGRQDLVAALRPLAGQPTATWLTGEVADPYAEARDLTRAAQVHGEVPVLVVYNLPERDCGQYSSGGAADTDAYLKWLGSLAAGLQDRPAIVILEPDAIAHALEGCAGSASADDRYRLLTEAVKIFRRQPGAKVYLDAGNASWIKDRDALAGALRASGVADADGFALNVSNFETTEVSFDYGRELSSRLDGARFVIDTSRNGAGPPPGSGTGSHASWCNPDGIRLGTPPTTNPKLDGVDALLWVKQPGDSDGTCRPGDPAAGTFDLRFAAGLLGRPLTE